MIPKLTDDAVSRLPLEAGRAELLEEIMSTPVVSSPAPSTQSPPSRRTRWLVPVAAAAAVVSVATVPLWWGEEDPGRPTVGFQAAPESPGTGYRAVLAAPGWTVENVEADSKHGGEVGYSKASMSLDITWYPEDSYESYVEDREHIVDPPAAGEPVTVLGRDGQLWAYDANDHTVIREPDLGHWMEIRGSGMDLASFRDLLGRLRLVSLEEFESSLPAAFVSGADRPAAVQDILAGIEAAAGVTVPAGTTLDTRSDEQDPYHLGADIAGQYACAWIAEFAAATSAGDQARAAEAARVMATSRRWPVLLEMNERGDYPEVVWEYADDLAAGRVPAGYQGGLGCH